MSAAWPLRPGQRLVHHDPGVGQRVALAGRAGGEQELPHRRRQPEAHRGDVAADELHRVVDRHPGRDRSAGAVDVEPDVGVGILALQEQQLGADLVGDVVVDVGAEHDHAVLEQAVEHVHARVEAPLEPHGPGGVTVNGISMSGMPAGYRAAAIPPAARCPSAGPSQRATPEKTTATRSSSSI